MAGDLEALIGDVTKTLRASQRVLNREVARAARKAILDDVRGARGGLRFGRFRLGAKTTIDSTATDTTVRITATPAGFWSIVENGSAAHEIVPTAKRVLAFDGVFATRVHHPGTIGHRYWAGAEDALERAVGPVIEEVMDEAFGRVA